MKNKLTKKITMLGLAMLILVGISNVQAQDYSLKFDGTDDYMPLPQSFNTAGALPTVSACGWIKINPGEGGWSVIDFDRSEYFNLEVGWNDRSHNFVGFNTTDNTGTIHDLQGTTNVRDGVWHFIAAVYDGTDKFIYVDGVLDATATNPHGGLPLGTGTTRYGIIGDGSEADSFNGLRNGFFYKGNLKKVSMWTKALSSLNINNIMNNGIAGSESGLYAYYKFDEGSGQLAADSGPNGFDAQLGSTTGTDTNDPAWESFTYQNNCLSFNGTDEYFEIPNNDDFNLLAHSTRTVELWFYANSLTGRQMIYDEGGYANGLSVYLDGNTLWAGGWSETYSWAGTYFSSSSISQQRWYSVVIVFDGTNTSFTAYLDGVAFGSASNAGTVLAENHEHVTFGTVSASGGTQYHDGDVVGSLQDYFNGYIDEFRAYNRALPLSEIQNNMYRELAPSMYGSNMICYFQMNNVLSSVLDISGKGYDGTFTNMDGTNYIASTAPLPYYSVLDGNWDTDATWADGQKAPVNAWARVRIDDFVTITSTEDCEEILVSSGASLMGNANLTATSATVDRDYTGTQWHMISSPVSNAVSGMFTGLYLMDHNETTNAYSDIISTTQALNPMQGYALWNQVGDATASFEGTMNDGTLSKSLTRTTTGGNSGWNLVGNPYPSSIDWNATSGWTKTNVDATIYLYTGSQWATWNGTTGTNGGTRYIASGQGFFVAVNNGSSSGTLGMTNSVRVHHATTFFKEEAADVVKLKVSGNNFSDETAIYFSEDATIGFDSQMDAHKLFSLEASAPNIYSVANNGMAVNVLPEIAPVAMNVKVGTETGTYTVETISNGEFSDLYLEDLATGEITDLNTNPYTFDYIPGMDSRFVLHFSPLGIDDDLNEAFNIYSFDKDVYVAVPQNTTGIIAIYDMMGKEIVSEAISGSVNTVTLEKSAYYIVKVTTDENIETKKVFIK